MPAPSRPSTLEARRRGKALEAIQIAGHYRLNISVDDGGAEPIKLANLRQHFAGKREPRRGKFLGEELFDFQFVSGV